jgi:hypothetical protein
VRARSCVRPRRRHSVGECVCLCVWVCVCVCVACSDEAKLEAVTTSQDTYRLVAGERRQPIVREGSWQEGDAGAALQVRSSRVVRCARHRCV